MRAIFCGLLSIGLVIAFTNASDAANKREKSRRSPGYYYSSPSDLTERQLRNQRAYERGEYYETRTRTLYPLVAELGGNKNSAKERTSAKQVVV